MFHWQSFIELCFLIELYFLIDIKYVLYNGFDKLCCSSIAFVDAPIDLLCVFNTTFNNISLILSVTVSVVL